MPLPTRSSEGTDPDDRRVARTGSRPRRRRPGGARAAMRRHDRNGSPGHGTAAARPGRAGIRTHPRYDAETVSSPEPHCAPSSGASASPSCCVSPSSPPVSSRSTATSTTRWRRSRASTSTTASIGTHGVNYLIIGSDSRAFVEDSSEQAAFGSASDTGPPRSDTLMVLHADGDKTYAVSFPRDLWVDIPGKGKGKINAAYNDGPQKVVDILKANFNIDINHYLEVNFIAFSSWSTRSAPSASTSRRRRATSTPRKRAIPASSSTPRDACSSPAIVRCSTCARATCSSSIRPPASGRRSTPSPTSRASSASRRS